MEHGTSLVCTCSFRPEDSGIPTSKRYATVTHKKIHARAVALGSSACS